MAKQYSEMDQGCNTGLVQWGWVGVVLFKNLAMYPSNKYITIIKNWPEN